MKVIPTKLDPLITCFSILSAESFQMHYSKFSNLIISIKIRSKIIQYEF